MGAALLTALLCCAIFPWDSTTTATPRYGAPVNAQLDDATEKNAIKLWFQYILAQFHLL